MNRWLPLCTAFMLVFASFRSLVVAVAAAIDRPGVLLVVVKRLFDPAGSGSTAEQNRHNGKSQR